MKRAKMTLARRHEIAGIVFSLPFIVGFLLFFLAPLIRSVYYSFTQISISGGASIPDFIGWDNFHRLFFELPVYKQIIVKSLQDSQTIDSKRNEKALNDVRLEEGTADMTRGKENEFK